MRDTTIHPDGAAWAGADLSDADDVDTDTSSAGPTDAGEDVPGRRLRLGRGRRVALMVSVAVVLAVLGSWLVAFSPVLGVRSIDVRGVPAASAAPIIARAAVPRGTPLVRLDAAAVARRVETLPEVASARVSTSFPSTVAITVTLRVAVGVQTVAGRHQLLDRTGLAFRSVATAPAGLPELVVPADGPPAVIRSAAVAVAAVAAALPAGLRPRVRSIQALDPSAITVVFSGGRIAQWGSAAGSAIKAREAAALLQHADRSDISVDVSNPRRPFTH